MEANRLDRYEMEQAGKKMASADTSPVDQEKAQWREKVNREIDQIYEDLQPEEEDVRKLQKTYKEFSKIIDKVMALNGFKHDLLVFGSSANGLALKGNSDLDLSVIIHNLPKLETGKEKADFNNNILL